MVDVEKVEEYLEEEDVGAPEEEDDGEFCTENEDIGGDKPELSGWADSIAKILKSGKPKNKKEIILSRARKDYEVRKTVEEKNRPQLEIIPSTSSSSVAVEKEDAKEGAEKKLDTLSLKAQRKLELKQKKLELAWENLARLSAEKSDPQLERDLTKMATKGVVQLFNAISVQQKTIKNKTKAQSEFKKDKILNKTKEIFDDAMHKSKSKGSKSSSLDIDIKEEDESSDDEAGASVSITLKRKSNPNTAATSSFGSKQKKLWNALQDDFMLDAKLKDWDKESESDEVDD